MVSVAASLPPARSANGRMDSWWGESERPGRRLQEQTLLALHHVGRTDFSRFTYGPCYEHFK